MPQIHSTAIVDSRAELATDVVVGPYSIVDAGVRIAAGSQIGPFCHLYPGAELESNVILHDGVGIGNVPQDLKFTGEASCAVIGAGTRIREYATVNRSSTPSGITRVGRDCLIMAYSHVAHDCNIGNRAIMANAVQLGGHVRMGEDAILSGMTGVHQFVTIGAGAFVGGGLRVDQDVPPYCRALGDPLRWGGLNLTGLRRKGSESESLKFLEAFYRIVHREGESEALIWSRNQKGFEDVRAALEDFFSHHKRTLLRRGIGDTIQ